MRIRNPEIVAGIVFTSTGFIAVAVISDPMFAFGLATMLLGLLLLTRSH